jgi:hypothetical protein
MIYKRDSYIIGGFFILIAGGLVALGLEDIINNLNLKVSGLFKIAIAFFLLVIYIVIRKKSERKKQ